MSVYDRMERSPKGGFVHIAYAFMIYAFSFSPHISLPEHEMTSVVASGYGRAALEHPRAAMATQWDGKPDADGTGKGNIGELVRAGDGRLMRVLPGREDRPSLIRPDGWTCGFHALVAMSSPGGPEGVRGIVSVGGVLFDYPGFPALPAGVAFPESAGEVLAEYGVPARIDLARAGRIDLYAELHLLAPLPELPGPGELIDLRLIAPIDSALPAPENHPALAREYYLVRTSPELVEQEGPGMVYLRLVGPRRAIERWLESAGSMRLTLSFAGTLLIIGEGESWTITPPG